MDLRDDFISELLLGDPRPWMGNMLPGDIFDFVFRKESQDFEIFDGILIGPIDKVLVELVRRSELRIKEESPLLRLAEFLAIASKKKVGGHDFARRVVSFKFADQLESRSQVAPLIVSADLDLAAIFSVEDRKSTRLNSSHQ